MIISMVMVRRLGSRERLSLKANTSKERRMVVDAMNGLMEASMRAILSTASSKVKVNKILKREIRSSLTLYCFS